MSLDRRDFLGLGAASAAMVAAKSAPAVAQARPKPVVIASGNGNVYTNGGDETCVARAFRRMTEGADLLDALIEGVTIVEEDPDDVSVGFGGLPDAHGRVTLDSCCMHGPLKRAGGVAAIQGVRNPSKVARAVADMTDHHLIVGQGAQDFARNLGFKIEDDLNTERSHRLWLEWKRRTDPGHYLDPNRQAALHQAVRHAMVREGKIDPDHVYGTINCNGINAKGEICGVTTTSGLAWKIPGRVGDSPILGAGLYVDNAVGAAGSTGRGEANLYNCASFLIVEELRRGAHPKDAGMAALKRILAQSESRLLDEAGQPRFNVNFYVLDKQGRHAGVAFYSHDRRNYAICDEGGPRSEPVEGLLGAQDA
ncbi:MAG: N(4)-(beta-N-acetylglucosaminyl)-L-asparaginase [Rhodothalassiaceae bacterium]